MDIKIRNISKSFGEKKVVDDLSMDINSESFTTLLGPSGCGKTTLLRMIAGLERPDEGEIYLGSRCVFSSNENVFVPPEKRGIGFVFQDFALWPHMKVKDNVAFGLRARKIPGDIDEKVDEALRAVQLSSYKERYPSELSGGQQQRVSFARAIVTEPECILFDEPLSALDALLRQEMRVELKALVTKRHITSVFVTHDQSEAMSMSDMIAIMHSGKIEQYDSPEEIYKRPGTIFSAKFIGSSNWIDDESLFRPESGTIGERENGKLSFQTTVEGAEYMGSYYRLLLSYKDKNWVMDSTRKYNLGETLQVNIDEKSIVRIKRGGK